MTVAAIHQPNFFPWLGYFAKIAQADVFVFLDAVDFPKNSWVNRVKLNVAGEAKWVTCPIDRSTLGRPIHGVRMSQGAQWTKKLLTTLETNYARAKHFKSIMSLVRAMLESPPALLGAFNAHAIERIARELQLETRLKRQSELDEARLHDARGSERLALICQAVDADAYLAGDGADSYEDESIYRARSIEFRRLGFRHPVYDQGQAEQAFIAGLSILDALFHLGRRGTRELLDRTTTRADNPAS